MRIAIYNLETQYTNIALEKIRQYWIEGGDTVEDYLPLWHNTNG